jgi:hypothetical protein
MACSTCGAPTKYNLCYKCKATKDREDAYALGYQAGVLATDKGNVTVGVAITLERWRQLVQLSHPDKHGDSPTAKDVTQWLQEIKPK